MNEKRLVRSQNDRMFCGVAAGLAEYFEIDPAIVRLIFVLSVLFGHGSGILLYIILCFLMPEATAAEKMETS